MSPHRKATVSVCWSTAYGLRARAESKPTSTCGKRVWHLLLHYAHGSTPTASGDEQFREKYLSELSANPNAAEFAREMASKPTVTLLYASRDESRNNAAILREYLQKH